MLAPVYRRDRERRTLRAPDPGFPRADASGTLWIRGGAAIDEREPMTSDGEKPGKEQESGSGIGAALWRLRPIFTLAFGCGVVVLTYVQLNEIASQPAGVSIRASGAFIREDPESRYRSLTGAELQLLRRQRDVVDDLARRHVGSELTRGSLHDLEVLQQIRLPLGGSPADLVLCDAAPKLTGVRDVDRAAEERLLEAVEALLPRLLRPGGDLLLKILEGPEAQQVDRRIRQSFARAKTAKSQATRKGSSERYLVAREYRPPVD